MSILSQLYSLINLVTTRRFDFIVATRSDKLWNVRNCSDLLEDSFFNKDDKLNSFLENRSTLVIESNSCSALSPFLLDILTKGRFDNVFLAGLDIESNVYLTAVNLLEEGFKPKVLYNYCSSSGGEVYHNVEL